MITILAYNPSFGAAYNLKRAFSLWEETRLITLNSHPLWPGEDDIILTAETVSLCRELIEQSTFTMIADAAGLVKMLAMLRPFKTRRLIAFWGDTAYWQSPDDYNELARELEVSVTFAMIDIMPIAPKGTIPLCHPVLDVGYEAIKTYPPIQLMHSPRTENKRALKGSDTIERVVSHFPDVAYSALMGLSWRECLDRKRQAHIFIDQLPAPGLAAGLGRSGEEALAFGSVVLTALHGEEYLEGYFPPPPVVKVYNENKLFAELDRLISQPETLTETGQEGRVWAEQWLLFSGWLDYVSRFL